MNSVFFRRVFHRSLIVLPLIVFMTFSVSGAAAAFKNIKVGDQALPVQLEDLEGQEHSLAKYRESKAILLFFWATWSQRSLTELADLKKFNAEYGDKGLQILAVNVENQAMDDEDLVQIRKVLEENEIDYPILIDKGLTTYNEWGVIATPTTAIISSDGVVTFDLSSYPSSAYLDMEQGIQKALGLYVEEEADASVEPSYVPNRTALLHVGMGKRHAEKGFMTKALPELEKAAVADSGWAEPHMYMGFVHFRMGDGEKAGASLEKAAQLDPQRLEITWLRAWLLTSEEKVDDAIALLLGNEPVEPPGGEPEETAGEGPAPADRDNSQAASPVSSAASDTATAGTPMPAAEGAGDEPLDLSEVIALKDAGKQDEAAKALEELLAGKLSEAGFTMKKKTKMSAKEKMQLMMQKNQGQ
ncbi:MAG: redoxin domain-containing protein [bacterium]|nr:redoxin domain-containing protein [bacterium]MDT8366928.1 redoxin domain-containing protein [bacterium]